MKNVFSLMVAPAALFLVTIFVLLFKLFGSIYHPASAGSRKAWTKLIQQREGTVRNHWTR